MDRIKTEGRRPKYIAADYFIRCPEYSVQAECALKAGRIEEALKACEKLHYMADCALHWTYKEADLHDLQE